jgi:type VI secretion system protein ImpB
VENTLQGDGSEMGVELKFNSIADFEPARVAEQVEPLRKLMETRNKLRDLMAKADRSEDLEELLERVLKSSEDMGKLAGELGAGGESKGGDA